MTKREGRPTKDEYFLAMAVLVATRSTCHRRAVGCVLVDARGHVLATGYNGRAAGLPHCNQVVPVVSPGGPPKWELKHACVGADSPPGSGLDQCEALHAEQNALLQCRDVHAIDTAYVTLEPCGTCAKLLLNTSCRRLVVLQRHYHQSGPALWERAGRQLVHQYDGRALHWLRVASEKILHPDSNHAVEPDAHSRPG